MKVSVGQEAIVFDPVLWGGKDVGDNSQFFKRVTILSVERRGWDEVATVRFHHDGRVSRGHFTSVMRPAVAGLSEEG